MHNPTNLRALLLLPVLFAVSSAVAQENTSVPDTARELREVVVAYRATKATPVTYHNVSEEWINERNVGQEASFMLAQTPGITNYSDAGSMWGYSYFRMRGIDQTRVNITLDGMPLNEPEDQGAYFSNIPDLFNSVSRIQVQRGVGTSQNGVASYSGSVQLFSPNLHDTAYARVGVGAGSFNSARVFTEQNMGLKGNIGLYARASELYSGGFKHHSSNRSRSAFVSTGLFEDKSTWKLNVLLGQQQNDMAWLGVSDSLLQVDPRANGNSEAEKDVFAQLIMQLHQRQQLGKKAWLRSCVYYSFLAGNYDFDLNNFLGLPSTNELYNYAFESHWLGGYSNYVRSTANMDFAAGIHGSTYQRRHTGSETTLGELYQNIGHKDQVSAFAKLSYKLGRYTLFADVQQRFVQFTYQGAASMEALTWQFTNPRAGATAAVGERWTLYYSLGRTGREPTRNDVFGGNDDLPADSLGNGLLASTEAEYVLDHEAGVRFASKKMKLNANLYYMSFENEIVLNGQFGPNGLALTNNVERSLRSGVEMQLQYQLLEHVALRTNAAYNYSRITEQGESFAPILTPPVIVVQEVQYARKRWQASVRGRYQHSAYIDFANEAQLSAYWLLDARIGYTVKKMQVSLYANNLTNADYRNHGYVDFDGSRKYFRQAPINWFISAVYNW